MKKNNNKKTNLSLLILSPILSLVTFVLTYFLDPLKYSSQTVQNALAAIPAFLLSVIILIIGQIINTHNEVENVTENSEIIYETVKNYLHVTNRII